MHAMRKLVPTATCPPTTLVPSRWGLLPCRDGVAQKIWFASCIAAVAVAGPTAEDDGECRGVHVHCTATTLECR